MKYVYREESSQSKCSWGPSTQVARWAQSSPGKIYSTLPCHWFSSKGWVILTSQSMNIFCVSLWTLYNWNHMRVYIFVSNFFFLHPVIGLRDLVLSLPVVVVCPISCCTGWHCVASEHLRTWSYQSQGYCGLCWTCSFTDTGTHFCSAHTQEWNL